MAGWTDVSNALKGLPGVEKKTSPRRQWRVKDRLLAWERPLRPKDLEELGSKAPKGPVLGVRVPLEVKEALLASKQRACFTTRHFDGYPAILVDLVKISPAQLKKLLLSAWDSRAGRRP